MGGREKEAIAKISQYKSLCDTTEVLMLVERINKMHIPIHLMSSKSDSYILCHLHWMRHEWLHLAQNETCVPCDQVGNNNIKKRIHVHVKHCSRPVMDPRQALHQPLLHCNRRKYAGDQGSHHDSSDCYVIPVCLKVMERS